MLMAPTVRRTQAPRGQTPILTQRAAYRQKVSLIAGLSVSPVRRRLGLYFQSHVAGSINNRKVAAFLRQVLGHLRGKVIVIWDGGSMHKGEAIRRLLRDHRRLSIEPLPPYAPELNPVESLWEQLKHDDLANYAPPDVATLDQHARSHLERHRRDPPRLDSFFRQSDLPWPPKHMALPR